MSEQSFRPKDGGNLRSNTLDARQHRHRRWRSGLLHGEQRVPLGFHRLDLFKQQFPPIDLSADLNLKMHRQETVIARPQFVAPWPMIAAQPLVSGLASREQLAFDTIYVIDPLGDQHLTFAAKPAAVLFFKSRRFDYRERRRFAPLIRQQRAKQRLAVVPVSLRLSAPT